MGYFTTPSDGILSSCNILNLSAPDLLRCYGACVCHVCLFHLCELPSFTLVFIKQTLEFLWTLPSSVQLVFQLFELLSALPVKENGILESNTQNRYYMYCVTNLFLNLQEASFWNIETWKTKEEKDKKNSWRTEIFIFKIWYKFKILLILCLIICLYFCLYHCSCFCIFYIFFFFPKSYSGNEMVFNIWLQFFFKKPRSSDENPCLSEFFVILNVWEYVCMSSRVWSEYIINQCKKSFFGPHCAATRMLCALVVLCFEINRKNGKLSSANQAIFKIQHIQGLQASVNLFVVQDDYLGLWMNVMAAEIDKLKFNWNSRCLDG